MGTINARRSSSVALNRLPMSRSSTSTSLSSSSTQPTVLNATATKHHPAASAPAPPPYPAAAVPDDPFVAISRAIHAAKVRATTTVRTYAHNATRINLSSSPSPPPLYYAAYQPRSRRKSSRAAARVCRVAMLAAVLAVVLSLLFRSMTSRSERAQPTEERPQQQPFTGRNRTSATTPVHAESPTPPESGVWSVLSVLPNAAAAVFGWFAPRHATTALIEEDAWTRELPPAYRGRHGTDWLIALVADQDAEACDPAPCHAATSWVSTFKRMRLSLPVGRPAALEPVDETILRGVRPGPGSRAMELSDLVWFGGHLLSPDDRTGALLEMTSPHGALHDTSARALLPSGGGLSAALPSHLTRLALGNASAPFKAEWMVVKDGELLVGGHGRPFTDASGAVVNDAALWVHHVAFTAANGSSPSELYVRESVNWGERYAALQAAAGVSPTGFLMHEAVLWSAARREWVFLPRRRSDAPFDKQSVEARGWNGVVVANERLDSFRSLELDALTDGSGTRGFSAAAFVPGSRERVVLAVRTVEMEGGRTAKRRVTESYVCVFDVVTGHVLLGEQKVSDLKLEGVAVL